MKSTNSDLTWDTINCIAILMMVDGHGGSFLSNLSIGWHQQRLLVYSIYSVWFDFAFCLFKDKTGYLEIL